jgi:hypothetical protein
MTNQLEAGQAKDQRTAYMRESFGNTDSDDEVEGWDFSKHRTSTSTRSHLWHIHISAHRKYIEDKAAMGAILSILTGMFQAQKNLKVTGIVDENTWTAIWKAPITPE